MMNWRTKEHGKSEMHRNCVTKLKHDIYGRNIISIFKKYMTKQEETVIISMVFIKATGIPEF